MTLKRIQSAFVNACNWLHISCHAVVVFCLCSSHIFAEQLESQVLAPSGLVFTDVNTLEYRLNAGEALLDRGEALNAEKDFESSELAFKDIISLLQNDYASKDALELLGSSFHQLGQIYKKRKDFSTSLSYHLRALETHQSLGEPARIAKSLKNVGYTEFKLQNYLASLDYLMRGIELHQSLDKPAEHAEFLKLAGTTYRFLFRFETSLEYMDKAQRIYTELGEMGKVADCYNQIGLLYTRLEKFDQAKTFYQKTVDLPLGEVPAKWIAAAYRELSIIELQENNLNTAMSFASTANQMFKQINADSKRVATSRIVAEIYTAMEQKDLAEGYFREALALSDAQIIPANEKIKVLNGLGGILLETDKDLAAASFQKALSLAESSGLVELTEPAFKGLIEIEQSQGNYREAFTLSEAFVSSIKALNEKREQQSLAFAKAKLDSYKMEVDLAALREKVELNELNMIYKNNQIELANQASQISKLELEKNKYASFLLTILLIFCVCIAVYMLRIFLISKNRNKELSHQAQHDPLTQCLNRRGLFNRVANDIVGERDAVPYCVVLADIDRFKSINDRYGHDRGDEVLVKVAGLLKSKLRKQDIVARYGGEEFCIVMRQTTIQDAEARIELVRTAIENALLDGIRLTCSFGVTLSSDSSKSIEAFISQADKALYYSKTHGRNRITVWHADLRHAEGDVLFTKYAI